MNRHYGELTVKARTHEVYSNETMSRLVVKSGKSGNLYQVAKLESHYTCDCEWQEHNNGSECSHVVAVRMFVDKVEDWGPGRVEVRADGSVVIH